jgi:CHAD domain-containing protein
MTTPAGTEVELKYRATERAAIDRLLEAPQVGAFTATGAIRPVQHEDVYVDTADGLLDRAGYAVRLRRARGRTTVGLKSRTDTGDGALHRRTEIEGPTDGSFDPHAWPASAARTMVLELAGDAPLVEVVTIRQLRRRRNLVRGDTTIELSIDDVDVVARGRVVDHFTEVELELVAGPARALDALARSLRSEEGLLEATGSKFETALVSAAAIEDPDQADDALDTIGELADLLDEDAAEPDAPEVDDPAAGFALGSPGTVETVEENLDTEPAGTGPTMDSPAAPSRPRSPGVTADDTLAEAGRKVLRFHFGRMLAHEAGTRSGEDMEDLHAMRVATRRMRAAWRVFGDAYRPERTRRYRVATRDVARRLGAVRDLDVLIDLLERYRAARPAGGPDGLQPLATAWRQRREDARERLLAELDSGRYRRFVDGFAVFVEREGMDVAPALPASPHRIRETTPTRIWAAFGDVRAYAPLLRWADIETLHDLRIAGKWLRYSLEFVREALGPEAEPLIARVVALQDHLGQMNDAHVAAGMARAFLVDHETRLTPAETAAIGRFLVDQEREAAHLRRTAGRPFRAVTGPAYRRALGRLVARL